MIWHSANVQNGTGDPDLLFEFNSVGVPNSDRFRGEQAAEKGSGTAMAFCDFILNLGKRELIFR